MTPEVKKVWLETSKTNMRNMFAEARATAKLNCNNSNEPIDWKGHGPDWLSLEHWNEIIDKHWNNEKWKQKSATGSKNRCSAKSGSMSKHTGGSIPFVTHAKKMREENDGNAPHASELFKRVHKRSKGTGDFVDNKSREVSETYEKSMGEKHGLVLSSQPVIDLELWCVATGGPHKGGSLYGLGTTLPSRTTSSTTFVESVAQQNENITSNDQFRSACEKIEELTRENEEMRRKIEETKLEEEQKRLEFMQKMEEARSEDEKKRLAFQRMVVRVLNGRNDDASKT